MAALPYMQLYVADYLAATAHLTAAEHGAYLLLLFNYWQRGESFKAKDQQTLNKRLACVARMSNEEFEQIKETLQEFFVCTETEWSHDRVEKDLEAIRQKSEKASKAGKASASKRSQSGEGKKLQTDVKQTSNERSTDVQQAFNERSTGVQQTLDNCSTDVEQTFNHKDKDTDKEQELIKEKINKKEKPRLCASDLVADGLAQQTAIDLLEMRKQMKAPMTYTVWNAFRREAAALGWPVEKAAQEWVSRGWRGFKAEWVLKDQKSNARASTMSKQEAIEARNKAAGDEWLKRKMEAMQNAGQ